MHSDLQVKESKCIYIYIYETENEHSNFFIIIINRVYAIVAVVVQIALICWSLEWRTFFPIWLDK